MNDHDQRRVQMFVAKWRAEHSDQDITSDRALRDCFAWCAKPLTPRLYPALRKALAEAPGETA